MPAKVYIYDNSNYSQRVGETSKAFNCVVTKELMREHNLQFAITNNNPFYKLLRKSSAFECDGQLFDIVDIDTDSGDGNITLIKADHVSYQLSDYMVPDNYSFVGTLPQIVADILEQGVNINDEKAIEKFSVGECYDGLGSVTYAMLDQKNITVRAALLGLTYLGVEVDFDNFTINCPQRIGKVKGATFDFTTNLKKFRRRWERDNDWTYDVEIADRGDISLGDDVTVHDSFIGDDTEKRIISYSRCIDDPTKNSITLGVFILDSASASVETGLELAGLNSQVDSSVQQGKQYNNVAITHELGFVSTRADDKVRVVANGTDCFAVQKKVGQNWVTVTQVDENGLAAAVLTTLGASNIFYATVGMNKSGNPGFFLYQNSENGWVRFMDLWRSAEGDSVIESQSGDMVLVAPYGSKPRLTVRSLSGDVDPFGADGTINLGNIKLTMSTGLMEKVEGVNASGRISIGNTFFDVSNGNVTTIHNGNNFTGALSFPDGTRMTFENGVLTNVSN